MRGERLEFMLSACSKSGSSLPLIVRRHLKSSGKQQTKTEQHVLVLSVEELDAWFQADPFNAECDGNFNQIRSACLGILKAKNED